MTRGVAGRIIVLAAATTVGVVVNRRAARRAEAAQPSPPKPWTFHPQYERWAHRVAAAGVVEFKDATETFRDPNAPSITA